MWSECEAILMMLTCTTFTNVIDNTSQSQSTSDDSFYFNKSIIDEETVLTPSDFELGSQLNEQLVDDDWHSETVYQNDRFEGDIAMDLNLTTVELFINGALSNKNSYYNAVRNHHQLWPNAIIPYAISSQYSTYSRSVIALSMQEYGKHTCIRWVPKRDNDISYVYIMPDRGCYSMVGRTGGKQMLSLGSGCIQKGIIMHELMHAVGFFHEQSRTDRDEYVTVLWNNILPGMQGQFEKYGHGTIQSLEMEYDYASIMHYGSLAFSRNGLPTIVPKHTAATIGQRSGFSKIDAAKINKLYNCPQDHISTSIMASTTVPITAALTSTVNITVINATTITILPTILTSTFPSITVNTCKDRRYDCSKLVEQGWCKRSAEWMKGYCPESCGMCGTRLVPSCEDLRMDCSLLVLARHCKTSKIFMKTYCAKSCGFCFTPSATEIPSTSTEGPVSPNQQLLTSLPPILRLLPIKSSGRQKPTDVRTTTTHITSMKLYCRDRKYFCTHWKDAGFCVGIFRSYMGKNCPHACGFC